MTKTWDLPGLRLALVVAAVFAGRVRRRRAPGVGAALGQLLAAFQAALPRRRRRRRRLRVLSGPRPGGDRRGVGLDGVR